MQPVMILELPRAAVVASVDTCHRAAEWIASLLTADRLDPQALQSVTSMASYEALALLAAEVRSTNDDPASITVEACKIDGRPRLTFHIPIDESRAAHWQRVIAQTKASGERSHWIAALREGGDRDPLADTLLELAAIHGIRASAHPATPACATFALTLDIPASRT